MSTATDRFKDYVPVSERLEQFYNDHPSGRVLTTIVEHDAEHGFVLMRAEIYRAPDDASPAATGHAFENRSEGYVNKTSYIENCETSATGRALALLGYEIKRGIASREEMQKTERMDETREDALKCPECGKSQSVITSKAEYGGGYLCFKKKGGCGAKWAQEQQTEGWGSDQALRDQYFTQAETLLAGLDPEKRKDALGRLLLLSTEEMGKKVNELAENARKKNGGDPAEDERQKKIAEIREANDAPVIDKYLAENFDGKALDSLSLDAVNAVREALDIPF